MDSPFHERKGFSFVLDYLGWRLLIFRSKTTEYKGYDMSMAIETYFQIASPWGVCVPSFCMSLMSTYYIHQ